MSVQDDLLPEQSKKIMRAMKAPRAVKRITFNPSEANPGETLYVHVPMLNEKQVLVPNSLALIFDIDLSGGHATISLSRTSRERDNMVPEGIQSEDLCKIRSNSGDKKTSGVDTEKKT